MEGLKRPEYICPICGRKTEKYKALRGHMMFEHREEFANNGNTLASYGITLDPMERIFREIDRCETPERSVERETR